MAKKETACLSIIVTRSANKDARIPINIWRNTKRTFDGLKLNEDGWWICTIDDNQSEVDHLNMFTLDSFVHTFDYTPLVGTKERKKYREER